MSEYKYDALGRIENVAKDGTNMRTYAYDAFGNRTGLIENGDITRYTYNALNQLVSKNNALVETIYQYDRRGNLVSMLENSQLQHKYVYGAINRLEEARNAHGEVSEYIYNGLGYRVASKNVAQSSKEEYVLDITRVYNNLLQKRDDKHTQTYLWDGNVVGMFEDGCNRESYYLQDDLGSVIRLLDDVGNFRESYGYDEFGHDLYGNQGVTQPFGFTGYQYDNVAGTYFAQAREYRAAEGRFAAMDIVRGNVLVPQTQNPYKYCLNQPFRYIDPSGCIEEESEIQSLNTESKGSVIEEIINGNAYGLVTDGLGVANAGVGTYLKNVIVNFPKPNNIGIGVWSKQVSNNLDDLAYIFGSSADDVVKGFANTKVNGLFPKTLDKLGYAGIALDVGLGINENIKAGTSIQRTASDAIVDVVVSGTTMMAAAEAGAAAGALAGSAAHGLGNIVGAGVGLLAGAGLYYVTDVLKINGKTIREYAKDGRSTMFGWY